MSGAHALTNQANNAQPPQAPSGGSVGTFDTASTSPEALAMQMLAGQGKKPKKRKETDKEKRKRQKEEMNEKIGAEVNRILKEQGIVKNGGTDDELVTEDDTVTSLRYELVKMQQELLRRKVLDPRHYNIASVDKHSLQSHGVTVVDQDNGHNPMGNRKKKMPPRSVRVPVRLCVCACFSLSLSFPLPLPLSFQHSLLHTHTNPHPLTHSLAHSYFLCCHHRYPSQRDTNSCLMEEAALRCSLTWSRTVCSVACSES